MEVWIYFDLLLRCGPRFAARVTFSLFHLYPLTCSWNVNKLLQMDENHSSWKFVDLAAGQSPTAKENLQKTSVATSLRPADGQDTHRLL